MNTRRIEASEVNGPREPCVYQINTKDGTALYVGYSGSVMGRLREHKMNHWWDEADHILIASYETPAEARAAESALIGALQPQYNIRRPGDRTGERDRATAILTEARARQAGVAHRGTI